jgi:hypothetical protein
MESAVRIDTTTEESLVSGLGCQRIGVYLISGIGLCVRISLRAILNTLSGLLFVSYCEWQVSPDHNIIVVGGYDGYCHHHSHHASSNSKQCSALYLFHRFETPSDIYAIWYVANSG